MTWLAISFAVGALGPFLLLLGILLDKPEPRPPMMDLREAYPADGWWRPRGHQHHPWLDAPELMASEARRYRGIQ